MRLLGSGGYSSVYLDEITNMVYGKTSDAIKLVQMIHPTPYKFAKFKCSDKKKFQYMCDYYPIIYSEKNYDEFYWGLSSSEDQILFDELLYLKKHVDENNTHLYNSIEHCISNEKVKKSIYRMYQLLKRYSLNIKLDGMENNLAVSKHGRLILLDIFYRDHFDE